MILAHFQSLGKQPVAIDMLNSLVRLAVIAGAVDFNIIADTPSKPVDFAGLRLHSRSEISSSVHSIDNGLLGCDITQYCYRASIIIIIEQILVFTT